MEKNKSFKGIAVIAICIGVVAISIAYAALSASLKVNGTATISSTTAWNIQWVANDEERPTIVGNQGVTVTANPTISGQTLSWAATFTGPNNELTLTAKIKNAGSLNAKFLEGAGTDKSYIVASGEIANHFTYSMTVNDSEASDKVGSILLPDNTATVVVKVKLNDMDNTTFESLNTKTATFVVSLPFEQAPDTTVTPVM